MNDIAKIVLTTSVNQIEINNFENIVVVDQPTTQVVEVILPTPLPIEVITCSLSVIEIANGITIVGARVFKIIS